MKKTRIIALVNLLALTASSFSPLYADTREDKLKQREAALTERAVTLSGKEIDLEDMEQALNRKAAELDEQSKTLQAWSAENTVREIELDDKIAQFNKDNALLAARNAELDEDRRNVDVMMADLTRKTSEAQKAAQDAEEKFKHAQERERLADEREQQLTAREQEVAASLSELNIARAELLVSQQNAEDIKAKLAALEEQEANLKTARDIFAAEKENLAQEKISLENMRAEAEKKSQEAAAVRAEAEQKSQQAEAVLALNEAQKSRIAQLERDIQAKTDEIKILLDKNTGPLMASTGLGAGINSNASVTVTENGLINWSDGSIRAKGFGIPRDGTKGKQAEALARRAAVVDLYRNMLEVIQGVRIDSKTTVKDFMASDTIEAAVSGTIRGVEIIDEKWEDGGYIVYGQVRQENLAKALTEVSKKVKTLKLPKALKRNGGNFTGLIVDARHLPLEQQKFFRIVDETGKLVYGREYADQNVQSKIGLCAYFDKIVYEENESRVGDNPLTIKAQRLSNENADIVIPNDAAEQIRRNKVDFLKNCKVIVVKS